MGKLRNGVAYLMIIYCAIEVAAAAIYTVGDTSGWAIGVDYGNWASDKTFSVGDTLVFNYPAGHTVNEVSASDYKSCTIGNAIASDSSGATSISLKTAGPHYYICGVPGHCSGGMKLSVTITAAAPGAGAGSTTVSPPSPTGVATLTPPSMAVPAGGTFTDPYSSTARITPPAAVFFAIYAFSIMKYFII